MSQAKLSKLKDNRTIQEPQYNLDSIIADLVTISGIDWDKLSDSRKDILRILIMDKLISSIDQKVSKVLSQSQIKTEIYKYIKNPKNSSELINDNILITLKEFIREFVLSYEIEA